KGYRMNHRQVTLKTDQTLKQRTTSDGKSFQKQHSFPENVACIGKKSQDRFHTYEDLTASEVETEELCCKSIPCSCYYKPHHIGVD
ncbi:hypothetical protein M9458_042602, partial [Cirrhinus mrigala]